MHKLALTLAFSLLYSLPSYGQSSVEEFYEDANTKFHQQHYKAAIIQLKNALQKDTEHVPSLVLSAQVYMTMGNPEAAEEALIKARVLGADRRYINLHLAEAYRRQGKFRSILNEVSVRGLPPKDTAELMGYHAAAWLSLGKVNRAKTHIEKADALYPNAFRVLIAKILLLIQMRDYELAKHYGELVSRQYPQYAESWNYNAAALHASGQLQSALKSYDQALQLEPRHTDARIAKIALLLDINRASDTLVELDYLEKTFPFEPRAPYLRSLAYTRLASQDNQYQQEQQKYLKICTEIIARLPQQRVASDSQLTMVAALAHYGLAEFEASKVYLSSYLSQEARDPGANRLMGDILIRLNDPASAIRHLKPVHKGFPNDSRVASLLATAYSQTGHHDKATALLEDIQRIKGGDSAISTQLAISLLQSHHIESGIEGLKNTYTKDATQTQAGFALVMALLKRKRSQDALIYARKLYDSNPNNSSYLNLLAAAQQQIGDTVGAKSSLTSLIKIEPKSIAAHINLAKLEQRSGNASAARQSLSSLLDENPDNASVLTALAILERTENKPTAALKLAEKAHQLDKSSIDIRVLLIELYLILDKTSEAESLAIDTRQQDNESYESSVTLAKLYSHTGETRKAVAIYKKLTKESGFHTEKLYNIATYLIENQAWLEARHALYKAIEGNPNHPNAQFDYVKVQLAIGELEDADLRSERLTKTFPENLESYLLLGESKMKLQQYKSAQLVFHRGLEIGFHPALVLGESEALFRQKQLKSSIKLLKKYWEEFEHPAIGSTYSLRLLNQKHWSEAHKVLSTLLKNHGPNPSHLNNLALSLDRLNDSKAIDYAQAAYELAPDNPYINDTLGWLLVKSGETREGLKYLRQAVVRATNNPELRYHLGKALLDLGRREEAKRELQSAIGNGALFEGRKEALRLLKTLT